MPYSILVSKVRSTRGSQAGSIALFDHLDGDEAKGFALFLVEMVAVEDAVDRALVAYYAAPGVEDEFIKQFLGTMTLGNKLQRLHPALKRLPDSQLDATLQHLVKVRNLLAHQLPSWDYDGGKFVLEDEIEPYSVYRGKDLVIEARTLVQLAAVAQWARGSLSALHRR